MLSIEKQIMRDSGLGTERPSFYSANKQPGESLRHGLADRLKEALTKAAKKDSALSPPDETVFTVFEQIAAKGEDTGKTLENTWHAAYQLIAAHTGIQGLDGITEKAHFQREAKLLDERYLNPKEISEAERQAYAEKQKTARDLEKTILKEIGIPDTTDYIYGTKKALSLRGDALQKLPGVINTHAQQGEVIAPANEQLLQILRDISKGERKESFSTTLDAMKIVIVAHMDAAHAPQDADKLFSKIGDGLRERFLQTRGTQKSDSYAALVQNTKGFKRDI